MSRQEACTQYHEALKAGQKYYKNCIAQGRYPYLQVLDEILDDALVVDHINLGIIEIPTEQIVGTKSVGRKNAFAANFMPLLGEKTEFAAKWINLCEAHLGPEGIHDPIRCYEYLGRFYVQEGNKRVSVLKSYDAPTIPGTVIRLVPVWSENAQVQRYYDFLQSYQLTKLYQVTFTKAGSFPKLQAALGHESDYVWTAEDRRRFLSGYAYFKEAFLRLGGETLPITVADAMLAWLKVYSYDQLKINSIDSLVKSLSAIWPDVKMIGHTEPIAVNTEPEEKEPDKGLFGKLMSVVFPNRLTVASINELDPEISAWTRAHEQGIRYLEETMGDKVKVLVYHNVGTGDGAEAAMEDAIQKGAQVLFTTTASLISACRKIAACHPNVRVLNCSVSMPYTGVRTYYSRIYEGKFISGAIAGAMSKSDEIGYVASYPIFGVPAGINAFALGAQLTNPRVRVKLQWSCLPGDPVEALAEQGVDFISTLDIPTPDQFEGKRGVCHVLPSGNVELLASPYWDWGVFYTKLINGIMNGGWDISGKNNQQAVNYWWGMSSGVIGMKLSDTLPAGVLSLVEILKKGICDGSIEPFHRHIRSQDGIVRNDGEQWLTPEEILHRDWLCDVVDGSIPTFDELLPKSQAVVRLLGIYRDEIPPEKEGVLL